MIDKKIKEHLLALPQVTGVGHGFKEVGGIPTDKEAIIVLVNKKLSSDQLTSNQLVPQSINGIVTDVIEVGEFKTYSQKIVEGIAEEYNLQEVKRTSRIRPAVPGVSIGHYQVTAGTFGAVVYDSSTGQPLILSNNHILANASNGNDGRAKIGDPILQPGKIDGGSNYYNIIAKLTRYITLDEYPAVNQIDCALAKPSNNNLILPEISGIGRVQGIKSPELGMSVTKSGRTTAVTVGQIRVINVTVDVNYGQGRVLRFENQILTTRMSEGGDSGSLVLNENNLAVGLLFAGSDQGTLVNPIQIVLDMLKVKF
ncbi:MAG: hypothetical protein H6Q63_189 [Firmicutes bacterium]|nr:hypothetical protein [Bacillota bacterium]